MKVTKEETLDRVFKAFRNRNLSNLSFHTVCTRRRQYLILDKSVGKRADLVILDRNLTEVDRYDIHNTRPVAVVMDGVLVHGSIN